MCVFIFKWCVCTIIIYYVKHEIFMGNILYTFNTYVNNTLLQVISDVTPTGIVKHICIS